MANDTNNDVVHLQAGDHFPTIPVPSPATEMLKQLLDQMLANERRRLRNEYVRIGAFLLLLLTAGIAAGIWFTHSLLEQLHVERQTMERSLQAMLQRNAPAMPMIEGEVPLPRVQRSASRAPGTDKAHTDIKRLIQELDAKKQTLTDMLKSQNAQTKDLLQSRDNELQALHARIQEVQRKVMNASPPEIMSAKRNQTPQADQTARITSLIVSTTNTGKLRLPIPEP